MTSTPSMYAQLALNATLCGPIARHFASRPSLREVASQIIAEQWRERGIAGPAPEQLRLYRWAGGNGYRVDTLTDLLIERFCQEAPLKLAKSGEFFSLGTGAEFPSQTETDKDAVLSLLNECGPFLMEEYKRRLVGYWGQSTTTNPAPWRWLAGYLQEGCRTAAKLEEANGTLDSREAATALLMVEHPEASERAGFGNLERTKGSLLSLDVFTRPWIDPDLASAVLIERSIPEEGRTVVLLYTLAGRLLRFDSSLALLNMLSYGGDRAGTTPFRLHLFSPSASLFLIQAVQALEQQLVTMDTIADVVSMRTEGRVQELVRRLDEATSFMAVCDQNQYVLWKMYFSQLPIWLREASTQDREAYSDGLIELATLQQRSGGRSFLDGVQPILTYAREQVHSTILVEHPQAKADDIDAVEVVNKQVTAASIGSGGSFVPQGAVQTVRMSLAQFALENLSALKAGTASLEMRNGGVLPDWLTLEYVKTLVTRLNLGERYPKLLRQELLDGTQAKAARLPLFVEQVRQQLPLLALENRLRGVDGMTAQGVSLIKGVFRPVPGEPDLARLRPVAFIRSKGAKADVALNAYLIERFDLQGPCVLYRPLHRQPLRQFVNRAAFLDAVHTDQALQDDLLLRLDASVRPVYAKGGFEQPHIVRFVPGAEFAPLEVPDPATLAEEAVTEKALEHLYLSCARELVVRAEAQSISNSEDRWIGYQELGWLMFNTLLPLLNGPVAVSSWMVQVFALLRNDLLQNDAKEGQLVASLFNLAVLLVVFPGVERARSLVEVTPDTGTALPPVQERVRQPTSSPSGAALTQLDFSWTSGEQRLSRDQQAALLRYKAEQPPEPLGSAVAEGPWQGFYHQQGRWWARIEGTLYEVEIVGQEARIVAPSGQPGPWLQATSPGRWQFNTELRLRGGMPLNRRIEQMRAANRRRLTELENRQVELLSQRMVLNLKLKRDLDESAAVERPSVELLGRYRSNLHRHDQMLRDIDENYVALNQMKSQPDFNQVHARSLLERAVGHEQLMSVLRSLLVDGKLAIHDIQRQMETQTDERLQQQYYEDLLTECEKAKNVIDEAITSYTVVQELCRQLEKVLPMGPGMVAEFRRLSSAPSLWAWRSSQVSMTVILILSVEEMEGGELYETVETVRLGLQMQLELEADSVFTLAERVEVLDGSVSKYAGALETLSAVEPTLNTPRGQLWLAALIRSIKDIKRESEEALANAIRMLPSEPEPIAPPADRKQVLIKTRRRGTVVARRRTSKSGQMQTVVIDPLENNELARFEESSEPGVWQMVEPPVHSAPQGTSLGSLLKRCAPLLAESDRQIARARSQARTATIGVEMEEILIHQARPLEQLGQQIENLLSKHNEVDTQTGGRDAVLEVKALRDKAQTMREEGRQLRIAITKRQLPTVARVVWLKSQDQISITRLKAREMSAKKKGRPQDYLQEYLISDKAGQPLWYAHFHYASLDAAGTDFTAAHLKTREQRFDAGQYQVKTEKNSQKVIEIYRSRIDKESATELFLNL